MGKITILITLFFTAPLLAEEADIPPALLQQVESGHAESAYFIGTAFAEGTLGIEKNLQKAKEWFLKSAEMGYVHGMYEIGRLLYKEKRFDSAKSWFSKAAEAGHAESFYRLSLYPIYGLNNEDQNCHKGYELLQQAISRGVKSAFNDYAWMLSTLPDKACRNGQKAWRIFAKLQGLYGSMDPIPWAYIDTKAAVLAELSEFNEAIEVQSWVVEDFCDVDFSKDKKEFYQAVEQMMQQFKQQDDFCYGAVRRLQTYINREPWREQPEVINE